jgi:hypothetical protein
MLMTFGRLLATLGVLFRHLYPVAKEVVPLARDGRISYEEVAVALDVLWPRDAQGMRIVYDIPFVKKG